MIDVFLPEKRSWIMSLVKGKNTRPELIVRSLIHRMGYRFRLYQKILPGNPDIILKRHKKVVFIHGCFWHGHKGCLRSKRPMTNRSFWNKKLSKNIERDKRQQKELHKLGWKTLIIWECQIKNLDHLKRILADFLEPLKAKGRKK